MMGKRAWLSILVLACALPVAGCQRTLFSQAPMHPPGCDVALAGHWTSLGDDNGEDGELEATVAPDCTVVVVEHRADGPRTAPPIALSTGRVGEHDVLWLDATQANVAFEVEHGPVDQDGTVYVFAWSLDGDVLTLHPPAHQRIARRIIDGALQGAVFAEGRDLAVRLDGTADVLALVLRTDGSIDRDKPMRFRRSPQAPE